MEFVDTHVHLHFPDYDEDREDVIQRAREAGVALFVNVGTDVQSSQQSLDLAHQYSFVWATAGIHPHDAKGASPEAFKALEDLLQDPRMVAIGEIGLDFFRDHSPHDKQREVFGQFLEMYERVKKPMVIHCREAYQDLISMLKQASKAPYRGVMHCFSGTVSDMSELLDLGFHISFAGPLTYKKNDSLRSTCQKCPIDRILLETDAPFLPPQSVRGKRNESSHMLETATFAARLHNMSLDQLGTQTTENARQLFGL